ncbi:serine/threonine-protein kinase NEK5 [Perilla frutescens var. hirtella]|nr:serine/threonine-protein kinase NEK5 [Perilla frutescens var. hirtella]
MQTRYMERTNSMKGGGKKRSKDGGGDEEQHDLGALVRTCALGGRGPTHLGDFGLAKTLKADDLASSRLACRHGAHRRLLAGVLADARARPLARGPRRTTLLYAQVTPRVGLGAVCIGISAHKHSRAQPAL